jgi:hypothetical protein
VALPSIKVEVAFNAGPLDLCASIAEFTDAFGSNPTSPWVASGGTWTSSGGKVGSTSAAGSTLLYTSTADGHIQVSSYQWNYVQATITATFANPASGSIPTATPHSGILFRYVDSSNYWILDTIQGAVYKVVAGVITAAWGLGPQNTRGCAVDGDTWDIYMSGSYIYVFKNDLFLIEINDSTYSTTGTKHGFRADSDTVLKFSNFSFFGAVVWTDVSSLVRGFDFGGGRTFEFDRMDARSGSIYFNNKDGRFDPYAQSAPAPYLGNILPNKRIRITATYSAVPYTLFNGLVEEWRQSQPSGKADYSEVTCRVVDMFRILSENTFRRPFYQEVMIDQPDHYWRLNDTSPFLDSGFGTYAADASIQTGGSYTVISDIYQQSQPGLKYGSGDVCVKGLRDDSAIGAPGYLGLGSNTALLNSLTYRTGDISWMGVMRMDDLGATYSDLISYFIKLPCQQIGIYKKNTSDTYYRLFIYWVGQSNNTKWMVSKTSFRYQTPYLWHIVRSAADGAFLLYVNGIYVETFDQDYTSAGGGVASSATNTAPIEDAAKPSTFPWSYMVMQEVQWFGMSFSDIAIFRKKLTPSRIKNHWLSFQERFAAASSGAQVKKALQFANVFGGQTNLATGQTTVAAQDIPGPTPIKVTNLDGSTSTSSDDNAISILEYVQQLSDSEDGQFYVADDGTFTFLDRWAKLTPPRTTSVATFGDGGGAEIGYAADIDPVVNLDRVYTVAEVDRSQVGGFLNRVEDAAAKRQYGPRVFKRSVVNNSDQDALDLAEWVVYNLKTPKQRFDLITIYPQNGNTWASVLNLNIGDRITHKRRPTGTYYSGAAISTDHHIQGIWHNFDLKRWVTKLAVSPAPSNYWVLGTSQLGTDTFMGY